MSLIGTLTSGVSAMRSFTKALEVIGNNVSNVNTVGFKGSTVSFADSFSNTLRSSAPSSANSSNQSATQVGTGVRLSQIGTRFTQGALSTTGLNTDLGISGNGFFLVENPADGQMFATRAGNFRIDDNGYLVTYQGYRVQGAVGGTAGSAPSGFGDIRLRTPTQIATDWTLSNATDIHDTAVTRDGAVAASSQLAGLVTSNASAATASDVTTSINNALTTANTNLTTLQSASPVDADAVSIATATRDALQAALTAAQGAQGSGTASQQLSNVLASLQTSANAAVTAANSATAAATAAATPPQLTSFSVSTAGTLTEFYSDGSSVATNQVLLQAYSDPSALIKQGDNLFTGFSAAGIIGPTTPDAANNSPAGNGLGSIQSGTLELANVDLTEEFANMITTQRSFQASSRLVTVSDQVLEEIVNLKR